MNGFYLVFPEWENDNDLILDTIEEVLLAIKDAKEMDSDVEYDIIPFYLNTVDDLKAFISELR